MCPRQGLGGTDRGREGEDEEGENQTEKDLHRERQREGNIECFSPAPAVYLKSSLFACPSAYSKTSLFGFSCSIFEKPAFRLLLQPIRNTVFLAVPAATSIPAWAHAAQAMTGALPSGHKFRNMH